MKQTKTNTQTTHQYLESNNIHFCKENKDKHSLFILTLDLSIV